MSTCIGWDDLVTIHSAVVDKESDLVHVGDFLAYQSVSNEVIKLSRFFHVHSDLITIIDRIWTSQLLCDK